MHTHTQPTHTCQQAACVCALGCVRVPAWGGGRCGRGRAVLPRTEEALPRPPVVRTAARRHACRVSRVNHPHTQGTRRHACRVSTIHIHKAAGTPKNPQKTRVGRPQLALTKPSTALTTSRALPRSRLSTGGSSEPTKPCGPGCKRRSTRTRSHAGAQAVCLRHPVSITGRSPSKKERSGNDTQSSAADLHGSRELKREASQGHDRSTAGWIGLDTHTRGRQTYTHASGR
jgi:hypothetical protein